MEFTVSTSGRLDAIIAEQSADLSRSKIQSAIKDGNVTVNGAVVKKPAYQVQEGEAIAIRNTQYAIRNTIDTIKCVNQNLEVLFEDDACMVINKPAGIAVHPGHAADPSEPTLLSGIRYLFEERNLNFSPDSVLVHRLDKPTTGCIIVAKSNNSHSALQKQFEVRTTLKKYIALVFGVPEHDEATIDAPIGRNLTDRTRMSVLKTSKTRDAVTDYRVLKFVDDCALVECTLHTGRTHQIRVHMASVGHPLLGDKTYGSPASKKLTQDYGITGLCLHASLVGFVSPADQQDHIVEAPMHQNFSDALVKTTLTD